MFWRGQLTHDIKAKLGVLLIWGDGGIANADDQEQTEREDEWRLQVLVFGGVERDGDRCDDRRESVAQLADRNSPGIGFEAQVQHNLGGNAVDSTVEDLRDFISVLLESHSLT